MIHKISSRNIFWVVSLQLKLWSYIQLAVMPIHLKNKKLEALPNKNLMSGFASTSNADLFCPKLLLWLTFEDLVWQTDPCLYAFLANKKFHHSNTNSGTWSYLCCYKYVLSFNLSYFKYRFQSFSNFIFIPVKLSCIYMSVASFYCYLYSISYLSSSGRLKQSMLLLPWLLSWWKRDAID